MDNNIGEKISLRNLSAENNRFLYVLPTMVLPNCIVKKLQNPSIDFNQAEVALFRQLFGPYFDICIMFSGAKNCDRIVKRFERICICL